jgi:hypothetical protein
MAAKFAANFNLVHFDVFSMFLVTFDLWPNQCSDRNIFLIDISHQITAHRCCEQLHSSLISSIRFCKAQNRKAQKVVLAWQKERGGLKSKQKDIRRWSMTIFIDSTYQKRKICDIVF